jgi:hypothetical protein
MYGIYNLEKRKDDGRIILKYMLQKIWWGSVDWVHVSQDRETQGSSCEHRQAPRTAGNFLTIRACYELLWKDSATCTLWHFAAVNRQYKLWRLQSSVLLVIVQEATLCVCVCVWNKLQHRSVIKARLGKWLLTKSSYCAVVLRKLDLCALPVKGRPIQRQRQQHSSRA